MSDLLYPCPLYAEPFKNNRFILRFPSDLGISEWYVQAAQKPSVTISDVEVPWLNTSTHVAGRYKWENIEVTFREFISPSTTQALMEWMRLCAESATGRQGYAAGYKRDIELEMLDPTGVAVQKWIIKNAYLSVMRGGSLDHGNDQISTVTGTITMDYALLAY